MIYAGSFTGAFHFDDWDVIVNNKSIENLWDIGGLIKGGGYHGFNRVIVLWTFAVNYAFGGLDVWGYHLVNLVFHVGCGMLVYWLARLIKCPWLIATWAGILFVVHPLQSQAVNYICQRFALMATFFYLLAITLYIKGRGEWRDGRREALFIAGAVLSGLAAIFCKEIAFTLPLSVLLVEWIIKPGKPKGAKWWMWFVSLTAIPVVIFLATHRLSEVFAPAISDYRGDPLLTPYVYFLTQLRVVTQYIWLTLLPVRLTIDHFVPATQGIFDTATVICALFLALTVYGAVKMKESRPIVAFGILFFFVGLLAESTFKPLRNVMFEHRVYLSMSGLAIAVAYAVFIALKKHASTFLVIFSFVLCFITANRNGVWASDTRLWEDAAKKAPYKERTHNNLGVAYIKDGEIEKARRAFETAYRLCPEDRNIRKNYVTAIKILGEKNSAKARSNQ